MTLVFFVEKKNGKKQIVQDYMFKLTVMFFGLTNSLVTFQMIINEILQD